MLFHTTSWNFACINTSRKQSRQSPPPKNWIYNKITWYKSCFFYSHATLEHVFRQGWMSSFDDVTVLWAWYLKIPFFEFLTRGSRRIYTFTSLFFYLPKPQILLLLFILLYKRAILRLEKFHFLSFPSFHSLYLVNYHSMQNGNHRVSTKVQFWNS